MTTTLHTAPDPGRTDGSVRAAMADAHSALAAINATGPPGDSIEGGSATRLPSVDADSALTTLRARHPAVRFSVVTDREAYDGSDSSALIMRAPGEPTVSLSVASPRELPWPLRGVQRTTEADLLAVNGTRLDVADAMVRLDSMLFEPQPMRVLIDGCLLDEALSEDPVQVSDDDIRAAARAFRAAKKLYRGVDAQKWLDERGLTRGDFDAMVTRHAELAALRERVTAGRVDDWIAEHRHALDVVVLAWLDASVDVGASADLAADPMGAVLRAAAAGVRGGVVQVRADAAPGLLDAGIGDRLELELDVPAVAVVVARTAPVVDGRTRAEVRQRLFREWLADRRADARITWFWGHQHRTVS